MHILKECLISPFLHVTVHVRILVTGCHPKFLKLLVRKNISEQSCSQINKMKQATDIKVLPRRTFLTIERNAYICITLRYNNFIMTPKFCDNFYFI